jgi:hypothetical protein
LALCLTLLGCAVTARVADQISASPGDHHLYRAFRAASELEHKLEAAWRYLKAEPTGRYRGEVRAWFLRAERDYRNLAADRPDLLRAYLKHLPDAPNAQLVADRIAELQLARTLRGRREAELTDQAREFEAQLAAAEQERATFLRSFADWVRRLAGLGPWGVPVGELGQEFNVVYTLQQPAAICDSQACVKQFSHRYVVPDRGKLSVRSGEFDVIVRLAAGVVVRAELAGVALFDRLSEASQLKAVPAFDPLARAEAIGGSVQLVGQALDERFPSAHCAREAVSPVVLERECNGLRVRMVAGIQAGEPDRVELTPIPAAHDPGRPARVP